MIVQMVCVSVMLGSVFAGGLALVTLADFLRGERRLTIHQWKGNEG